MYELRPQPVQKPDVAEDCPGRITVGRKERRGSVSQPQREAFGLRFAAGEDRLKRRREIDQRLVRVLLICELLNLPSATSNEVAAIPSRFTSARSTSAPIASNAGACRSLSQTVRRTSVREPRKSVMYGLIRLTSVVIPLTSNTE
jgi:hypothetical protein